MEQYLQDSMPHNNFNKEDTSSLNKWKSSSESIDESENRPSGGFDCNICLDIVHDPVVTLCGHLYCWPCIYKWIHHQQTKPDENLEKKTAHCPVCKSEVSQKTIVPLYGYGQTTEPISENKDRNVVITVPHRPTSVRGGVNTVPAQQVTNRNTSIPILMTNGNGINPTSPTTRMFAEIVYEMIYGKSDSGLFAYPNSYNVGGTSSQRLRRHEKQADESLSRISFFLLCCVISCLLLF